MAPMRAPKPCYQPGCPVTVPVGTSYCKAHEKARRRQADERRESASKRGYDASWRKLRTWYLANNPICEWPRCKRPATEVDHIKPINRGGERMAADNLQGLCKGHHSEKTNKERG